MLKDVKVITAGPKYGTREWLGFTTMVLLFGSSFPRNVESVGIQFKPLDDGRHAFLDLEADHENSRFTINKPDWLDDEAFGIIVRFAQTKVWMAYKEWVDSGYKKYSPHGNITTTLKMEV